MSQRTTSETAEAEETVTERRYVNRRAWTSATVGGIAGGVVFGVLMQTTGALPGVASLYGLEGLTWAWVAHLFHSIVFGLVFGGIVTGTNLRRYADSVTASTGLGAGYGVALWFVAAAVAMPLWMGAIGMDAPAIPNLDPMSLVGHVVYGVVLGAVFAALYRR
jgi:hypothetical protein